MEKKVRKKALIHRKTGKTFEPYGLYLIFHYKNSKFYSTGNFSCPISQVQIFIYYKLNPIRHRFQTGESDHTLH